MLSNPSGTVVITAATTPAVVGRSAAAAAVAMAMSVSVSQPRRWRETRMEPRIVVGQRTVIGVVGRAAVFFPRVAAGFVAAVVLAEADEVCEEFFAEDHCW